MRQARGSKRPKQIGAAVRTVIEEHDAYPQIHMWFDGACEPKNPGGIATGGWLIKDFDGRVISQGSKEICRGPNATNNVAEYAAIGFGLRWLLDNYLETVRKSRLFLRGDSDLVVNQINLHWRCNKPHLEKLRDRCREILTQLQPVSWDLIWIPRKENQEADALSRSAYEAASGEKFPTTPYWQRNKKH